MDGLAFFKNDGIGLAFFKNEPKHVKTSQYPSFFGLAFYFY